ncbi:MAG: alpha/beta fold hydrolase [Rubellimicrobium sp.]|nr:alpha/beta fold hydrolase [Rubellimicrobium sp.]
MMRGFRAALAAFVLAAGTLPAAAEVTIPTQDGWNDARQQVTLADGLNLAYVELGEGDGTPLILLHGYTDNSRSWSLVGPWLGERPIYALDLRGHGASDIPACCYGLDSLAHDVLGFMDALGIERADIVGHSLGSMTAGVVAGLAPERVEHLVLISSALKTPDGSGDWLWDEIPAMVHPVDPDGEFMQAWYANPNPVDEDFLQHEMRESASRPAEVWMGALIGLTITDWTPIARRIEAPTLVFWGDQDGLFDAASQDALRAALPEARFETFEGYGHNMFWELPEQTGRMISEFLAQ